MTFDDRQPYEIVNVDLATGEILSDIEAELLHQMHPNRKTSVIAVEQFGVVYNANTFEPFEPRAFNNEWSKL